MKCVLLEVSEESKAYRLYDPLSNKIVISRDVTFNKNDRWPWNSTHADNIDISLDWGDQQDTDPLDHNHNDQPTIPIVGDQVPEADQPTIQLLEIKILKPFLVLMIL